MGRIMDRHSERTRGMVRVLRTADDGTFDREFWRTIPAPQRLELIVVPKGVAEISR